MIIWSSNDKEVAEKIVFMYALNSMLNNWWEEVILVIWGPSDRLISEDVELQNHLKKLKNAGVKLEACIDCTEMYGVSKKLEDMGVEVKGMGAPLTEYLKNRKTVITF